jgi:hypothetical protein
MLTIKIMDNYLQQKDILPLIDLKEIKNLKLSNKQILQKVLQPAFRMIVQEDRMVLDLVERLDVLRNEFFTIMKMDFEEVSLIYRRKKKQVDQHVRLK